MIVSSESELFLCSICKVREDCLQKTEKQTPKSECEKLLEEIHLMGVKKRRLHDQITSMLSKAVKDWCIGTAIDCGKLDNKLDWVKLAQ